MSPNSYGLTGSRFDDEQGFIHDWKEFTVIKDVP